MSGAARHQLPQDQPAGVNVDPQERVAVEVDRALEDFRCHVTPGADLSMYVTTRLSRCESQCQPEVRNASRQVRFEQNIFALEVAMGDGRLEVVGARPRNLLVEVHQPACHRLGDLAQLRPGDGVRLEVVAERAQRLVLRDEPKLDFAVLEDVLFGPNEVQDVGVVHARQLVDLLLGDPRLFVLGGEDFDGDLAGRHFALPHRPEAAVRLDFDQVDGADEQALRRHGHLRLRRWDLVEDLLALVVKIFGGGAEADERQQENRGPDPLGGVVERGGGLIDAALGGRRLGGRRLPDELLAAHVGGAAAEVLRLALVGRVVDAGGLVAAVVEGEAALHLDGRFLRLVVGFPQREAGLRLAVLRPALNRRRARLGSILLALLRIKEPAGDCRAGMVLVVLAIIVILIECRA